MKKLRVMVFPCGSECGLEIGRSLRNLKEIELFGASSVDDHGKFAFPNYIDGLPFVNADGFIGALNEVIEEHQIDYVYPAMDSVVDVLAQSAAELSAKVIGSSAETTAIALSKKRTYAALSDVINCPYVFELAELKDSDFPVFMKPEIGCGSKGVLLAKTHDEVVNALAKDPSLMILEFLPGDEYTIDCFTDNNGQLLHAGPRQRRRVSKGISVNTVSVKDNIGDFTKIAEAINEKIKFHGAWFFQLKHDRGGALALLEIAPRIAGSMGLQRNRGVNLPLLSIFSHEGLSVSVHANDYDVEFDRAFYNKVKLSKEFTTLYLDFDDCLMVDGHLLNTDVLKLVGQFRNRKVPVILISRHAGDLEAKLAELGVRGLFDEVIHLRKGEPKTVHMTDANGVLIDDSFKERLDSRAIGVASLGPESVEALLN